MQVYEYIAHFDRRSGRLITMRALDFARLISGDFSLR